MEPVKNLADFPPVKTCNGCGKELPRTPEFFEPCRAKTLDGLRTKCRACERERDRKYRAARREAMRVKHAKS